jgi:hypothetical protein
VFDSIAMGHDAPFTIFDRSSLLRWTPRRAWRGGRARGEDEIVLVSPSAVGCSDLSASGMKRRQVSLVSTNVGGGRRHWFPRRLARC